VAEFIKIGPEYVTSSTVHGDQTNPEITALAGGGYVVTWQDYSPSLLGLGGTEISLRVYDANGNPIGPEQTANPPSIVGGQIASQSQPAITSLPNGGFVLTWTDPALLGLTGDNVITQIYDASGNQVGGNFSANGGLLGILTGDQDNSSVTALANGNFLVTWSNLPLLGIGGDTIQGQIISATGTKIGDQFVINNINAGTQDDSVVTGLSNGGFVVTWVDTSNQLGENSGSAIAAQIYDANGVQVGNEFRVNTTTAGSQTSPEVTALANGNFVVAWSDPANGGDIKAQIYTATGTAVGSEFTLNGVTTGAQGEVSIAARADGGFVAVWQDNSGQYGDASGSAIVLQAYDATGAAVGTPVLVNTSVTGNQADPTVAVLADGSIAVSWETPGPGGNTQIVTQRLVLDSAPTDASISGSTVPENSPNGTVVGTVTGVDPDSGDTLTYSLTDDAGGAFTIDPNTGVVTVADSSQLDFESATSKQITVRVTDAAGLSFDKTFTIAVSNVDEHPILNGTPGDDVITAPSNDTTTIYGGDGNDTLTGNGGNDTIYGGNGDDVLSGMDGDDTLYGGAGADDLYGGNGNDGLYGGDNNDRLYGGNDNDLLNGGEGDDQLYGGAGTDTLNGNGGNDLLDGGTGADAMAGGAGDDTYVVDNAGDTVTEAAGEGNDTVRTSLDSYTLGNNLENLVGTNNAGQTLTGNGLDNEISGANGNDTITGGGGNDTLEGNGGDDTIYGGPGNDRLDGGTGADTMVGSTGNDTYVVDDAGDVVTEAAGQGTDTVETSLASYTLADTLENLTGTNNAGQTLTGNASDNVIIGANGNDIITGLDGDDTLSGNGGNDTIYGGTGNDRLDGGAGADTLVGGSGDDTYVVDNVGDTVTEAVGGGNDTVETSLASYSLTDGQEIEKLVGTNNAGQSLTGNALDNTISGANGNDTISGLAGNDVLNGNGGNDTIYGGAGADTLDGGAGADTMAGGTGNDVYIVDNAGDVVNEAPGEGVDVIRASVSYTLTAGSEVEQIVATNNAGISLTGNELNNTITGANGNDTISGLDGNDVLGGGAGNDTIYGGEGDDRLNGGVGADTMAGGNGNDTYTIDNSGDTIVEAVGGGNDIALTSVNYTLGAGVELERLAASSDAGLTLTGNALDNRIDGAAGNDTLRGMDGNDTLYGNAGDDSLQGGNGADTMRGGDGNDTLDGGAGNDLLDGGVGADTMRGGAGDDVYIVDDAGDVVVENSGQGTDAVKTSVNFTLGSNLEQLIATSDAGLVLTGNALANYIQGAGGNDTISGLDGNDTLYGQGGDDLIHGGNNNDSVYGGAGADTLYGDAGNDRLDGGAGVDVLIGGLGDDVYYVDNSGDTVQEAAGEGRDSILTTVNYTLAEGVYVEKLVAYTNTGLTLTGNSLDNEIAGGAGADTISGMAGDDTLNGNAGNDTIFGNEGKDLLNGGDGNDTLYGGLSDDIANGGAGVDIIYGDDGNDKLDGGAGNDTMYGGTGDDQYTVDSQGDVIVEAAGQGYDTILTSVNYTLSDSVFVEQLTARSNAGLTLTGNFLDNRINGGGGADSLFGMDGNDTIFGGLGTDRIEGGNGNDTVRGDEGNDTLYGNAGDDSLSGGDNTDILYGGDGNDTLDGGAGNDTLVGGLGNDTYRVDSQSDIVQEASGQGSDTILTTVNYTLANTVFVETLSAASDNGLTLTGNDQDNRVNGRAGNDTLFGGGGNDVIYAGAGNDVIHGGLGFDQLRGEAGADRFVLDTLQDSGPTQATADRILDFSSSEGDKIDLSAIDAISGGANDAFTFVSSFSHVAGQLTSTAISNGFLVQGDVNGDGTADFALIVSSATPLTATDFVL